MIILHPLIRLFLQEKQLWEWLAPTSIKLYKTAFNHLYNFDEIDIDDPLTLNSRNFKNFLYSTCSDRNWSSHAYNRIRKDLSVFCKWLVSEKILQENPFDAIPQKILPKKLPKHFTNEQVEKMKYAIHRIYPNDNFRDLRAKAIFYTYLYTWMRLYELINLNIENIDFQQKTINIKDWKWRKERKIPLLNTLIPILQAYEHARNNEILDTSKFFPTQFWWTLQHREIYGIIKRLKKLLDFPITPHMFRHTFATELAKKNLNIYNLSQILWHTNINTTKIYLSFQCDSIGQQINGLDIYK